MNTHLPPSGPTDPRQAARRRAARMDLAIIAVVVGGFFFLAAAFQLSEKLIHWTSTYERLQADELPLTLLMLSLCLAVYSRRRAVELAEEITARQSAETLSQQMLAQNRLLAQQLIATQEQERRHLARELHDEIGQYCVAIKFEASSIAQDTLAQLPQAHTSALAIGQTADHLHAVVRGMLDRLRPTALDELGLQDCLKVLTEGWVQRHRTACTLHVEGALDGLGEAVNITLYRIVQESLTNIAKHAAARHVEVTLHRPAPGAPDAGQVRLRISDDGRGIAPEGIGAGLGLVGMRERCHALGGTLSIQRQPAGGTEVEATLPIAPAAGGGA